MHTNYPILKGYLVPGCLPCCASDSLRLPALLQKTTPNIVSIIAKRMTSPPPVNITSGESNNMGTNAQATAVIPIIIEKHSDSPTI